MTTSVSYVPASPANVVSVSRIRLYLTPARTGTPVVDAGPATLQLDDSWLFTFTTPADGFYYSAVTVSYTNGQTYDDKNDTVPIPAPPELQSGEQWVASWELDDPDDPNARDAARSASLLMYALSGRKYQGEAIVREHYALADWFCGSLGGYVSNTEQTLGMRVSGLRNSSWAWSGRPDPRYRYDYIRLRRRPAKEILEVTYGPDFDDPADPSTYQLSDKCILEFITGARHETKVKYRSGVNPPAAGRRAARALANELLKGYSGDATCRLPDRITSVSRQGVSYTVLDSQEFLKDGRTGIYEIDIFLKTANPDGARKKSRVFTPDLPRVRRS